MKKGISTTAIAVAILSLIVFFVVAYGFSTKAKDLFSFVKTFGGNEEKCGRTGIGISTYKGKLAVAEDEFNRQVTGTGEYISAREKLTLLYNEIQNCLFIEKLTISEKSEKAISEYNKSKLKQ